MHTPEQDQQIEDLAFQLWEQQGFPHGVDWAIRSEAERRLGFLSRDQAMPRSPAHRSITHR